jgi:hypothetical protein
MYQHGSDAVKKNESVAEGFRQANANAVMAHISQIELLLPAEPISPSRSICLKHYFQRRRGATQCLLFQKGQSGIDWQTTPWLSEPSLSPGNDRFFPSWFAISFCESTTDPFAARGLGSHHMSRLMCDM